MARSFHAQRERIVREFVLCHAEDEKAAHALVADGGGELLNTSEEIYVKDVEETVHSRRRRNEPEPLPRQIPALEPSYDEGAMGDELLSAVESAPDKEPLIPSHPARAIYEQQRHVAEVNAEGHWRILSAPGEVPQEGDEYRLNAHKPWELVPRSLIGHALSPQARAQFRTRRNR